MFKLRAQENNGMIPRAELPKPITYTNTFARDRKSSLINTDGSLNMRKLSKEMLEEFLIIPNIIKPVMREFDAKPFRKDLHKRKLNAITKKHRIQFIKTSVQEKEMELENPEQQLELVSDRLTQFLEKEDAQEVSSMKEFAKRLLEDRCTGTNKLLINELKALIEYESKQKKKRRVNASFDLLDLFREDVIVDKGGIGAYLNIVKPKLVKFGYHHRKQAIENYLIKKKKRKEFGYIRYKVRRELASKRVRCKGKFVKKPKVNLELMAQQYYRDERKNSMDSHLTE
jgi:hypothetical protein